MSDLGASDLSDAGYAAIDALTALMILATTIVLALGATQTARRASERASEARQATALLRGVLQTTQAASGSVTGQAAGFTWATETNRSDIGAHNPQLQLCQREATARAIASGRSYRLVTAEICSVQGPRL